MSTKISLWQWKRYSYELQKLWGKWLWAHFGFVSRLALIVRIIFYEKWVQKESYSNNTRRLPLQLVYAFQSSLAAGLRLCRAGNGILFCFACPSLSLSLIMRGKGNDFFCSSCSRVAPRPDCLQCHCRDLWVENYSFESGLMQAVGKWGRIWQDAQTTLTWDPSPLFINFKPATIGLNLRMLPSLW